jgi:hypothetical protein
MAATMVWCPMARIHLYEVSDLKMKVTQATMLAGHRRTGTPVPRLLVQPEVRYPSQFYEGIPVLRVFRRLPNRLRFFPGQLEVWPDLMTVAP